MRVLILLYSLLALAAGYKMLIIAPAVPPSQIMFNSRVAGYLAKAGHDVTIALMHNMDGIDHKLVKIPENIKVYHVNSSIGESFNEVEQEQGDLLFQDIGMFDARMRKIMGRFMTMFSRSCRSALRNQEFMNWLKESKFDLAFVHMYHLCPIGLVHTANYAPPRSGGAISFYGALMDYISDFVGSPLPPSYNPPIMMVATDRMNFYERTKSFIGHNLMRIIWPYMTVHPETQIFREELDPNFPDLMDLASNCSLVMTNSHPFYELPRPLLAKIVHIGGIGMQLKDAKPLPKELEAWVQEGDGAVVLSFGSIAPLHNAPESWKVAILKAFGRLPQYRFIMRYMGDDLKDRLPSNVKIMKWLPQSDLLQHPRIKAFVSHGGYNGFQETIAAGKPMVMIPLLGDQPKNAKLAERHGMAVVVPKSQVNEENLYSALEEILSNPSYGKAAAKLAWLMSKQPVQSDQLLVKWAELMAEVKHLDNLFPAGLELNFFQYHSLDVIAFLFLITGTPAAKKTTATRAQPAFPHCPPPVKKSRIRLGMHSAVYKQARCIGLSSASPPLLFLIFTMVSFLLASATVIAVCSAGYIPPYYGGYGGPKGFFDEHGNDYADHSNKYGGYGGVKHGHGSGYEGDEFGKASGENGYYGGNYGSKAAADGHANYANGGADGYGNAHHDAGARNAEDADGMKKYSYFSSGSGPEGSYSKGYYGSDGYEHADSKAKYVADANGNGYKKGYNYDENDHADGHSGFDKNAGGHSQFRKKHADGYYGYEKDSYEKAGHADGWVNGGHAGAHAAHGPSY